MSKEVDIRVRLGVTNHHEKIASDLSRILKINGRLDLKKDTDRELAKMYLAQRVLRTNVYVSSGFLNNAVLQALSRIFPVRGIEIHERSIEESNRVLNSHQETIAVFIAKNYPSPEEKRRARTIELSINELFATATTSNIQSPPTKFRIESQPLDEWGNRWRRELLVLSI